MSRLIRFRRTEPVHAAVHKSSAIVQRSSTFLAVCIVAASLGSCTPPSSGPAAGVYDPGVRGGPAGAGGALSGLTPDETTFFQDGLSRFLEVDGVKEGLGPRFNSNSCFSCHAQPNAGGSSPALNPQVAIASLEGAKNVIPWFITADGPVRESRFKLNPDRTPDGGVHAIFTISGRSDAPGCNATQPDFLPAGDPHSGQGGNPNIIFRMPTPVFGAGLIEAIPDEAIMANLRASTAQRSQWGIAGHPNAHISGTANTSGNDGTVTRFGWKAQNKSLIMFSGEAYNVEMGVTNQIFPQERGDTTGCLFNATPEDGVHFSATSNPAVLSDVEAFAIFMRLLAPPTPAPDSPNTIRGRALFGTAGCTACHTPSLTTGPMISSGSSKSPSAALSSQTANLYSDLLVHNMGEGLSDGISQGGAGPDEFRTAPLWGVGQRIFFLHDGRTKNLVEAVEAHKSRGSEANQVIERFNKLSPQEQQDIINFLRSL
jgi:CxxC motif-containing protein (DUF1111 family)